MIFLNYLIEQAQKSNNLVGNCVSLDSKEISIAGKWDYKNISNLKKLLLFVCDSLADEPDETDIWRENLKAWTLKQREKKESFTDDLQKTIEDHDKVTERAHYKGEF